MFDLKKNYPAIMALKPRRPKTFDLDGHRALRLPIRIPIAPKLENPQRAYVDMTIDLSF